MSSNLSRSSRRTLVLFALVAALLAAAFGVTLAAATHSAQAKVRHHGQRHHAVHARKADTTADNESTTGPDPAGGPNDQSGAQSGPNDTTGGPDSPAESKSSEGENSTANDPPGGANCVDNQGCQ